MSFYQDLVIGSEWFVLCNGG